jgi:hypothetical protein
MWVANGASEIGKPIRAIQALFVTITDKAHYKCRSGIASRRNKE